ncbi:MAG: oligosaccharide flippase family protein [Oliverpabstia sp.]|nr:oligosaccharide flippase family protein [Oliverpabstia sp.]
MNKLLQPDSTKKNFIFQFTYQFIILVVPLIVSPYLTRALGGTSLGIYSYTYSIAYYFVVFAMLGINKHGQRIISQRRSSLVELRKTFWSLLSVHFSISTVAILLYVVYVFLICRSDVEVALAQTLYVASAAFDLTWLFYGLEKFKTVAIRNAIIRLVNTVCIFVFVKSSSDIVIYTIIMAATVCAGQLVLFPQVFTAIPPIKFSMQNAKEHIRPLLTLFAAVVAATLYTVFDKTLLGLLATKESVAYYEYSDKIINIPKTFIAIISTVLYPKACQYAGAKDYDGMQSNMEKSVTVTGLIGFAAFFGLLSIADQFALLYYGDEFAVCGSIISMMCPLILIVGIG